MPRRILPALLASMLLMPAADAGQALLPQLGSYQVDDAWRRPVKPFALADHSWYVGTEGLSAILVKTDAGAVLIDGGMPQAADVLLENLRALGVPPDGLKWIVVSHAHADHAGPLAAVKRATGARVAASAEAAALLERGGSDDIHFADRITFPPLAVDRFLEDGERVEMGDIALTAHVTPGHTPGSASWTWTDTRDGAPLRIAYADSLTAPGYRLIGNARYPRIVDDYRRSFDVVRGLPCDLLITPHPDFSGWAPGAADPHPRNVSCAAYADEMSGRFEAELAQQQRKAR